jgi:TRAP-type C4-dicarboxylate transport system permease small subunit
MTIEKLKKVHTFLCRLLEIAVILAVAVLVLDVLWGVTTRWSGNLVSWMTKNGYQPWDFLPDGQAKWSEELARFMLIWVSLLGGAAAFGEKAHLGVDYFVDKLEPAARKFVTVFGHLVVLAFAIIIFVYGGIKVIDNALSMEQMTPALGFKMGHVYLALPISGFFIILFAVEQLLETLVSNESSKEEN